MKKYFSATYVSYFSDPRAYKIDESLAQNNEVYVYSPITTDYKSTSSKIIDASPLPLGKWLSLIRFWLGYIYHAIVLKPDYIIAHNYYLVFPTLFIKLFNWNTKIIYDSYELYVPTRRQRLTNRERLFYYLEQLSIRSYDLVIAANEERARLMKVKFRLKNRPLSIANISTVLFKDKYADGYITDKYPEIKRISDKTILVYQGVLGAGRNLDSYLRILSYLPKEIAMLFVGGGPDYDKLVALSKELKITSRIVFLGNVPMADINPILKFCNVGLIAYPFSDLNNRYCSPNKIYEYPAAGIPMISTFQTTIVNVLKPYNIACFIDLNKIEESAQKIVCYINSIDQDLLKQNIESFLRNNTWNNEFSKLEVEINRI